MDSDLDESRSLTKQFLDTLTQQFNKQAEPVVKQANDSWDQFTKLLQTSEKRLSEITIETKTKDGNTQYTTEININGGISNEFPNQAPGANDPYWARHNLLVDKVMTDRQAIIDKAIDAAGTTIKGIINPISFSAIDLVKLVEMFKKSS
jgi:hypothetical protein